VTSLTMTDAAYFTSGMLAGAQAVAGYIGGPDADHVWADSDWKATGSHPKLPIWVPAASATATEARAEVLDVLNSCLHYHIPRGQAIAFDLETSKADASYMQMMSSSLAFFGYGTVIYGSASTIGADSLGYLWKWDADWTGSMHLTAGCVATQWENGAQWDTSEVSEELFGALLWKTY
jgi:hypothetical protein